jgi:ArsR family transcriptional regulator, arsenate/arsenite/antimonite-responsive transcriptional repressor
MEAHLCTLKALADGNRLRTVVALMEKDELCVCQIVEMLKLATPTVSRHMSILQAAGLVQSRKEGRWVYYRLKDSFPVLLREWLQRSLKNSPAIIADREVLGSALLCGPKMIDGIVGMKTHSIRESVNDPQ